MSSPSSPSFTFPDPAPVGVTVFLAIYISLLFVVMVPVTVILVRNRSNRIIAARSLGTLIPLLYYEWMAGVAFAISIMVGKPAFCEALDAFYLLIPVAGVHYNLNIPNLVFQDTINNMKVDLAHSGPVSWVDRVVRAFRLPFRYLYTFVTAVVVVGIYLVLRYVGKLPGDCNRASQLTYTIMLLFIMFLLSYFLIKVARVRDPFFLKFENNCGTVLHLPVMILSIIYPIAPQIFPPSFDYRWVMLTMPFMGLINAGIFPVLLTFPSFRRWLQGLTGDLVTSEDFKELDTKGTIFALSRGVDVFQAVLNDPDLCEAFTQFTVTQWCVENVLFYKAVEEFKVKFRSDPEAAKQHARYIIREYISNSSALEVNLDFGTKRNIFREIDEELTLSIFDNAQKHVYNLMESDSFAQWQRTGDFKRALEAVITARGSSSLGASNRPTTQVPGARTHTDSPGHSRNSGSRSHTQMQAQNQTGITPTDSEVKVQIEMTS